jgi:hypothetical protein
MNSTFVHVDEAIATAESFLPDGVALNRTFARQWAYLGLRDIGPGQHWFAECVLHPNENRSMRKPDDMYKAMDIALYGTINNTTVEFKYSYKGLGKRIHNRDLVQFDGLPVDLSEDQYCFHLGSNGSGVNYAHLKYIKLPIGTDGLPLIPEFQVLAIAFFIVWLWNKKQNDKGGMQLAKIDYTEAKKEAKRASRLPSGIEMTQVAKEWVNLLNAPQFKQF